MLTAKADEFLNGKFGGKGRWVEAAAGPWVYLSRATAQKQGRKLADVEAALAEWLRKQYGIQAVYTRDRSQARRKGTPCCKAHAVPTTRVAPETCS